MNLGTGVNGMVFTALMDGTTDLVDGYTPQTSQTCGVVWSRFGLAQGTHTLNVTIVGVSPNAPASDVSQAAMDFTGFM